MRKQCELEVPLSYNPIGCTLHKCAQERTALQFTNNILSLILWFWPRTFLISNFTVESCVFVSYKYLPAWQYGEIRSWPLDITPSNQLPTILRQEPSLSISLLMRFVGTLSFCLLYCYAITAFCSSSWSWLIFSIVRRVTYHQAEIHQILIVIPGSNM